LPNAMPQPMSAVPENNSTVLDEVRMNSPKPIAQIAAQRIVSMLHFSANFGAMGERSANASSGIVVMSPVNVLERCSAAWICGTTGPTLVMGARRLEAIKTIPISSMIFPNRVISDVFSMIYRRK